MVTSDHDTQPGPPKAGPQHAGNALQASLVPHAGAVGPWLRSERGVGVETHGPGRGDSAVSDFEQVENARASSEARQAAPRAKAGHGTEAVDAALKRYLATEHYLVGHEGAGRS